MFYDLCRSKNCSHQQRTITHSGYIQERKRENIFWNSCGCVAITHTRIHNFGRGTRGNFFKRPILKIFVMVVCQYCSLKKAIVKRPKTGDMICKECFFLAFEEEIHQTIISNNLFKKGERIAIGASGGKGILPHRSLYF